MKEIVIQLFSKKLKKSFYFLNNDMIRRRRFFRRPLNEKRVMKISRKKLIRESFDRSKLLEPGYRYSYREVEDFIKENKPDWEGMIRIEDENNGLGEYIIYLQRPDIWLHTWERPLNDWSYS